MNYLIHEMLIHTNYSYSTNGIIESELSSQKMCKIDQAYIP
jgi:hypothetical protein